MDRLLGNVCAALLPLHRGIVRNNKSLSPDKPPGKVLLTKLVGLGDMVLLISALRRIREALPEGEIHFLATPASAEILTGNCPYVDHVMVADILKWKNPLVGLVRLARELRRQAYDAAIDFEQHFYVTPILLYVSAIPCRIGFYYYPKRAGFFTRPVRISPHRHMMLGFLDLASALVGHSVDAPEELAPPVLTSENQRRARAWLRKRGVAGKPYIVIFPGCGPSGVCRAWPRERFAEIALRLGRRGFAVLVSGSAVEKPVVDFIMSKSNGIEICSLAGELPLCDQAAVLDGASLLLANDTGPMHLGAALRVPTLGLFGPENPERYKPYGRGNGYLYVKQPCSPCNHNYKGVRPKCTNRTYQKCMREISVDRVEATAVEMLRHAQTERPSRHVHA